MNNYIDELNNQAPTEAPTTAAPAADKHNISANENKQKPFSCDHSISLYYLNQMYFLQGMGASPVVSKDEPAECRPPYWASYVRNTNLLLRRRTESTARVARSLRLRSRNRRKARLTNESHAIS
ncbi:Dihydropyridine-sensitive l-type calcium channel [Operophtera brumata]|uniref:Dihydropyridine-sensitive l-type calcium channel n=1 Tax=Operophtera brumata TaxID=104452 RepID=A0A0L7L818_OPEBR|nr:Dihydropyridine-sensitive l-type calcium channel [Operophtera brumata]